MNRSRIVVVFLSLLFLSLQTNAQKNYPKTLLWRITGKGLTQPSYLFGTMHLNDKRLFDFGDSVYKAIERTAGLAIEVNPDELCAYYVNQLFDELENTRKLDEILDKDDLKKFGSALSKKFDKPADKITASDIVKEKNRWMQDLMEKGEMPTFVDAYLYNIARRQGKWLGGIEDLNDQAGLMEDLVDKSDIVYLLADDSTVNSENRLALDQLIKTYINQDLNAIEATYNSPTAERAKDLILTRRNIKMARRIDSLVALRTMFLAIGAAHLPGDSGVIQLLQHRGFKVEPVFSSKKIAAKDYKFKEVQIPWVQVKDEQDLYKVEMPANPASVKMYGMLEMKFLFDIFNMSGFCTMAIVNPGHAVNKDTMIAELTQRMFSGNRAIRPINIVKDGVEGKEYIQKHEGSHMRLQVFALDKIVYMVLMASVKKEAVTSEDANKFFKSFTFNKSQPAAGNMRRFTDSIMGISISTPAPVTHNKQFSVQNNESFKITSFTGTDAATGSYIMLFSREVKPGFYILSDSVVYDEFYTNLEKQYEHVQKKELYIQGNKAAMATGRNLQQKEIFVKALSVIKNNRNIMVMVIGDSANVLGSKVDDIFSSLQFIDQPAVKWKNYQLPDKTASAWAPTPFRFHEEESQMHLIAYDTTSSTTFFVTPDSVAKYSWVKNDSTFWAESLHEDFAGKMVYEKPIQNGDIPGREYLFQDGNVYTRLRMLPNGNMIYKIFAVGGKQLLESEDATKFFTGFRLQSPRVRPTYLDSKINQLLNDLSHTDTTIRVDAFVALQGAPFVKEELPKLHEALFKPYLKLFENSDPTAINNRLGDQIAELKDISTIRFIEQQYPLLKNEKAELKATALRVLARMHTSESYALLKLMVNDVPVHFPDYALVVALRDSLELTAEFFPSWLPLAKDSLFSGIIAHLAIQLTAGNHIAKESVAAAEADFLKAAAIWAERLKKDPKLEYYNLLDLLTLLSSFNTPASNAQLQQFLPVNENTIRHHVAFALLGNKQTVPAYAFDSIAADRSMRTRLYTDLRDLKKLNLFPKKYLTQVYFAESEMYTAATYEAPPSEMQFLGLKKANFRGVQYNFYLYRVRYATEDYSYHHLGIAGGFDRGGKKVELDPYLVGFYGDEEFDKDRVQEFFEKFLEQQKEE